MKRPTCEHGLYADDERRCRKRATVAIRYRKLFWHQITGNGERPVYSHDVVALCCEAHADAVADADGRAGIEAYLAAVAQAEARD
jgi:hypothetical protein